MQTILVVDDEALTLRGARMLLEIEGYRVLTAEDGKEALFLLDGASPDARPDLVLTDRMMPELDGLALSRALRADAALDGVPIVLMSAGPEPVEHDELYDTFLPKPVTAHKLMDTLEEVFSKQ